MANRYPWDLWLVEGVVRTLTRHEHFAGRLAVFVKAARNTAAARGLQLHACIPKADDRDRVLLYVRPPDVPRSAVRGVFGRVVWALKEAHTRNLPADWTRNTRQDA